MKQLAITITAHSPLAIGRKKPGGSVSEVEQYIPGSVLRGAIASQILSLAETPPEPDNPNDDFTQLFTSAQPAIFCNAYSAIAQTSSDTYQRTEASTWVIPATAVSAKANPGFQVTDGGGVFDTLIDRFCAERAGYPYEPTPPDADAAGNDQVEPFSGFYSCWNEQRCPHRVDTRLLTRVGINRKRAVAEDQILYSVAVINESFQTNTRQQPPEWEPMAFRGYIRVANDELADRMAAFINARSRTLRLGSSGSRGLGKVTLEVQDAALPSDLNSRIDRFNAALNQRWQTLWSLLSPTDLEDRTYFTLDLQSDAILTDQWRRTITISPEMLQRIEQAPSDDSLQLHATYSSYGYRSGWNAAWGLMKDQALVTQKGSVYLLSTTRREAWLEALTQLETLGIGDRTAEGYGQVRVCHEFHQIMREELA
ncbi:MAG: CRISPR-associated RAMP protein Csx10 [Leptolyngbya sp. SIO4C1]|nr:CRISPR-associated RAMP protein Csx10 [Leptolyngbya sp. SIO4C1]